MVPLTMYLLRYGVIKPALDYGYSISLGDSISLQFSDNFFLILVIINILLGAAGYVINDYFDRKIDIINRPDRVIVGNSIHRRFAIILHSVLNGIAILLAAYLSWQMKKPIVIVIYVMISGIFWFYSTTYKKQFLIGNIIVALGTAMIPLQVAYFDIVSLNSAYAELLIANGVSFKILFYLVAAFAVFAFLVNLLREIIKDIEDFEGDRSYGCNTLPIMIGVKYAKIVSVVLVLSTIWLLWYVYQNFLNDPISKWYLLLAVAMPLFVVAGLILRAKTDKHYHILSWIIKMILLTGILYAGIAKYIMVYNFTI
jgi:4-hydroxybenzoate polyprenyltransferase